MAQHAVEAPVEPVALAADQAEAAPARGPMRARRPDVAATLSVVPGLGQLYNLQIRKAIFFFLAVVLTIPPGCILIANSRRIGFNLVDAHHVGLYFLWVVASILIFLLLFLLGLTFWASAIVDARRSARELSEGRPPTQRWWLLKL